MARKTSSVVALGLAMLFASMTLAPSDAQAGTGDALFEKVKGVLRYRVAATMAGKPQEQRGLCTTKSAVLENFSMKR